MVSNLKVRDIRYFPLQTSRCLSLVVASVVGWLAWSIYPASMEAANAASERKVSERRDMKVVQRLLHKNYVQGLSWSPDGSKLATLSAFGSLITIWDSQDWKKLREISQYSAAYSGASIIWVANDRVLTSAGAKSPDDGIYSMNLWDSNTGSLAKRIPGPPPSFGVRIQNQAAAFALSSDGSLLAMTLNRAPNQLVLFETREWSIRQILPIASSPSSSGNASSFAIAPDLCCIAIANGRHLQLIDLREGKVKFSVLAYEKNGVQAGPVISSLKFSPDGSVLASSSIFFSATSGGGGPIRIWDSSSGSLIAKLSRGESSVPVIDWSPDGKRLAAVEDDRMGKIWEFGPTKAQSNLIFQTEVKPSGVVAFARDGALAIGDGVSVLIVR